MATRHASDDILHFSDARILDDRRKALEEAFFRKENERLRARLHAQRERSEARDALGRECGVADASLLDRLLELGIRADTVQALVLVPLAMVAWADGKIDPRERDAVLAAAAASGIAPGSPSHALLEAWTREKPPPELFESWRSYVAALAGRLAADHRLHLEEQTLGRARAVAEAAGGFLGLAKVSREEEAVLAELARAFSAGPPRSER